jgi:hypothetical protein
MVNSKGRHLMEVLMMLELIVEYPVTVYENGRLG